MTTVLEPISPNLLDTRALLHRINARIVALRRALAHDHRDEPFWTAFGAAAPAVQSERAKLRWYAHLLHVHRATRRGRIHGRFETLDKQRVWLAQFAGQRFPSGEVLDL